MVMPSYTYAVWGAVIGMFVGIIAMGLYSNTQRPESAPPAAVSSAPANDIPASITYRVRVEQALEYEPSGKGLFRKHLYWDASVMDMHCSKSADSLVVVMQGIARCVLADRGALLHLNDPDLPYELNP